MINVTKYLPAELSLNYFHYPKRPDNRAFLFFLYAIARNFCHSFIREIYD